MRSSTLLRAAIARAAMPLQQARSVLGVAPDASPEAVKQAFRSQALKWHPDRNPSDEASARFSDARRAFEAVSAAGSHAAPPRRPQPAPSWTPGESGHRW